MYALNTCCHENCTKMALSEFDSQGNLLETEGFCLEHSLNPEESIKKIRNYVLTHEKIIGLNASYITFSEIDIADKKFYGCNFQHCTFRNLHSTGLRARMCMFDFSTFTDCNFLSSNIQFSSFAGSKLVHTVCTGSDLIHNNFNGITAYQSSFDDSDLYNSRFIKSVLINTSMTNCNLKKTAFYESVREGVSFHLSNTREALIDRNLGGLIGDVS